MDHYARIGVRPTASIDEIRAAYRAKARRLHPDRWAGDERAMQDLNEAWRVLGDPARRRAYDAALQGGGAVEPDADPTVGAEHVGPPDPADLVTSAVRNLPWVLVLVVLAAIFVVTAVARSPEEPAAREADIVPGECVVPQPGVGATEAPCTGGGARQVVSVPDGDEPCPTGTERFEAPSLPRALCLDPPRQR